MGSRLLSLIRQCPPASPSALADVQAAGLSLHAALVAVLQISDGFSITAQDDRYAMRVYGTDALVERSQTYDAQTHWPGALLFGDDGGGRGLFLDAAGAVHLCDLGAPGAECFERVADSLDAWIAQGFRLPEEDEPDEGMVDLVAACAPPGGLGALRKVLVSLGRDATVSRLRAMQAQIPFTLVSGVSPAVHRKLLRTCPGADAWVRAVPHPSQD